MIIRIIHFFAEHTYYTYYTFFFAELTYYTCTTVSLYIVLLCCFVNSVSLPLLFVIALFVYMCVWYKDHV